MGKLKFLGKRKRSIKAFCMAALMLITSVFCYGGSIEPAMADDSGLSIHRSGSLDCFRQTYKNGVERDWNVLFYRTNGGAVTYCVEYEYVGPETTGMGYGHSNGAFLSDEAKDGIDTIMSYGYIGTGDEDILSEFNIGEDEAEAATAVAIKKYLAAIDEPNSGASWDLQNKIYPKSGYETAYEAMNWLYTKAMNGEKKANPNELTLTYQGNTTEGTIVTHTFKVNSTDYTASVTGLTAGTWEMSASGDTITVKSDIPSNIYNTLHVNIVGTVPISLWNVGYFQPDNGSYQYMVTGMSDQHYSNDYINVPGMGDRYTEEHTDKYGKLKISKTDSGSGDPLAAAVFEIYADEACTSKVSAIITGYNAATGKFDAEYAGSGELSLPSGTYYVKETIAPVGYNIDDTGVKKVKIESEAITELSFTDTKNDTTVSFTKFCKNSGEVLAGAKFALFDADTATALAGLDKETPVDASGLTAFDLGLIELTEKIGSGTIDYTTAEYGFINTVVSNKQGLCEIDNLLAGHENHTVVILEVEAPEGYLRDESIMYLSSRPSELTGVDVWEVHTPFSFDGIWLDWAKPATISIQKVDQNGDAVKDAVYGIYTDKECKKAAHELAHYPEYIAADSESEPSYKTADATITTGVNGQGTSGYLMEGTYYIKEITSPAGYELNDNIYVVKVGGTTGDAVIDAVDQRIYGTIALHKTDSEDINIDVEGAVYGLYTQPDELYMTFPATNEYGTTRITDIPLGTYYVKEIKAPEGYELNPEYYEVVLKEASNVNADGKMQYTAYSSINVSDVKINSSVIVVPSTEEAKTTIKKVDQNGDPLIGAKLQILDVEKNVVEEFTSAETAYVATKLEVAGKYYLHEVSAPDGYELAEDIEFSGAASDDITVTMVDKAKESEATSRTNFYKVDENKDVVVGAGLTLYDSNGTEVDSWVTGEQCYTIPGLTIGETYTLRETKTPNGYITADDIVFTVVEGSQDITMIDNHVTVIPQTGDRNTMFLLLSRIFALASAVLCAFGLASWKKKII